MQCYKYATDLELQQYLIFLVERRVLCEPQLRDRRNRFSIAAYVLVSCHIIHRPVCQTLRFI
jgi:hypothetical protein